MSRVIFEKTNFSMTEYILPAISPTVLDVLEAPEIPFAGVTYLPRLVLASDRHHNFRHRIPHTKTLYDGLGSVLKYPGNVNPPVTRQSWLAHPH